jgi:hypothetical protein
LLGCVALDPEGPYGELVDALALIDITEEGEQIIGVAQGYKLMNAIKTTERKLANGTLLARQIRADGLVRREREDRADRDRDPRHQAECRRRQDRPVGRDAKRRDRDGAQSRAEDRARVPAFRSCLKDCLR